METAKKERRAEQASQQELQRGMYFGGSIFVTYTPQTMCVLASKRSVCLSDNNVLCTCRCLWLWTRQVLKSIETCLDEVDDHLRCIRNTDFWPSLGHWPPKQRWNVHFVTIRRIYAKFNQNTGPSFILHARAWRDLLQSHLFTYAFAGISCKIGKAGKIRSCGNCGTVTQSCPRGCIIKITLALGILNNWTSSHSVPGNLCLWPVVAN